MKVLVYANAPTVPTGFGTVIREIFTRLLKWGVIEDAFFFGINWDGSPQDSGLKIWPAQIAQTRDPDLFGRRRFGVMALQGQWDFDTLFLLEDHFTLSHPLDMQGGSPFIPTLVRELREQVKRGERKPFRVIQYIPVDSDFVRSEWVDWIPEITDVPVAYTQFGKEVLTRACPALGPKLIHIPHGTSPDVFFPIPPEERQAFRRNMLKISDETPLLLNVNRNQPRKDVPTTLCVLRELRAMGGRYADARLICHMNMQDSAGFNLARVREHLGLPIESVMFPANFSEGVGIPARDLNAVYNAADVFITTARGEGWGLPITEAMSAGVPIVAPKHTSHAEILGENRGVLVPCRSVSVLINDNDLPRPVAEVREMAEAVKNVLDHPAAARDMARTALVWAKLNTWDAVTRQWERVFTGEIGKQAPVRAPQVQIPTAAEWPLGTQGDRFRLAFGGRPAQS